MASKHRNMFEKSTNQGTREIAHVVLSQSCPRERTMYAVALNLLGHPRFLQVVTCSTVGTSHRHGPVRKFPSRVSLRTQRLISTSEATGEQNEALCVHQATDPYMAIGFCIKFNRGYYQINPKPCWVKGLQGKCMFVWECINSGGRHVGMCVEAFMFGTCCAHNLTDSDLSRVPSSSERRPQLAGQQSRPSDHPTTRPPFITRPIYHQQTYKPSSQHYDKWYCPEGTNQRGLPPVINLHVPSEVTVFAIPNFTPTRDLCSLYSADEGRGPR
ncbi:hypothetical protein AAG570_002831 [Ranatra chinensis]|uniref:Uncharacterized protein n=1 Tax=Ranatra chinensis TaxID=642074 RepID=A0ABD0Y518_9HEMI